MTPRFPALLVAFVLAAAGCSTGSDPTDAVPTGALPTPSATPTTEAPTPTPAPTTASPTPSGPDDPLEERPGLETTPPPGQPPCQGSTLIVTDADSIVTPTHKREIFVVRTTGKPCSLRGYPTVRLLDRSGRQLPIKVQHGGYGLPPEQVKTYTISRDTSLSFEIGTARDGSCQDVDAISAVLPGTSTAHRAATVLRVCGTTVGLSPVHIVQDID